MYDLVSADGFDLLAKHWFGSLDQCDTIFNAVGFALRRNPHAGFKVPNTPIMAMPLRTSEPTTVYYVIDEDRKRVVIHSLANL